MNNKTARLIGSFLTVGRMRPAPGTWGSLAALPAAYALHIIGGFWLLLVCTVAAFFIGWKATQIITADEDEDHDPSWIVIDEVVGMWIALFPVSYGAIMMDIGVHRLWPGWIAGFVLFRLFDISKPWIVGKADRLGTPLGVMLDDVFAGLFAALGAIILASIYHGVMM
ncbi:phosphatidylglycerophosphatase A family protein [Tropicibacter oceani]|uniref:Phosphatidylglycerophosphatase A n=1 Tax=Tropicibacter oceani TaxID=3058420 RepID=A0ABY8QGJ7_9RHOB|nr:phosphatidylglycerophosphatase A [Tropicibacter oceani]WGW03123.1 phosphatidylglycerophosphatase A [Tropicibacter oceani]